MLRTGDFRFHGYTYVVRTNRLEKLDVNTRQHRPKPEIYGGGHQAKPQIVDEFLVSEIMGKII
jgi:hypothetical protein